MTLKELAHIAQKTLAVRAGCAVRHSHVHELIAAAFGYRSWAAFLTESLLADSGVGGRPVDPRPQTMGRAIQLQYGQGAAEAMADALIEFIETHQLTSVPWSAINDLLKPMIAVDDQEIDMEENDWLDEVPTPVRIELGLTRDQVKKSPMLMRGLEKSAEVPNHQVHFLLASLHRCKRPNPYLYEESLRGRALNATEQRWVDDYLRLEPEHRKYEEHLRAAALGGVRAAALEYGTVFENPEFCSLAERLAGDVDPVKMAQVAATPEARSTWLRTAAEQGSRSALGQLAAGGDPWAEECVAEWEDIDWLRRAAERALEIGDSQRAWTWQYLALERGDDLCRSTLAAYHDGGQQDGDFYDSDFGGAMYVAGDEGLALPDLNRAGHQAAKAKALEISERAK